MKADHVVRYDFALGATLVYAGRELLACVPDVEANAPVFRDIASACIGHEGGEIYIAGDALIDRLKTDFPPRESDGSLVGHSDLDVDG